MLVRRIRPLSLARITGLVYAALGLIAGAVFSAFAVLLSAFGRMGGGMADAPAAIDMLFGIGSIVFFPVLYGALGFVGGLLVAFLYNWIARLTGGLELEVVLAPGEGGGAPSAP